MRPELPHHPAPIPEKTACQKTHQSLRNVKPQISPVRRFWCALRGSPSAEYFRIRVFRANQARFGVGGGLGTHGGSYRAWNRKLRIGRYRATFGPFGRCWLGGQNQFFMENTEFGLVFPPEGPMVEVPAEYHALPGRISQMVGVPRSRAFWCQIGGSRNTPLRGPPSAEYFRIRVFRANQARFASKGAPKPPGARPIRPGRKLVRFPLVAAG